MAWPVLPAIGIKNFLGKDIAQDFVVNQRASQISRHQQDNSPGLTGIRKAPPVSLTDPRLSGRITDAFAMNPGRLLITGNGLKRMVAVERAGKNDLNGWIIMPLCFDIGPASAERRSSGHCQKARLEGKRRRPLSALVSPCRVTLLRGGIAHPDQDMVMQVLSPLTVIHKGVDASCTAHQIGQRSNASECRRADGPGT